MKRVLIAGAAVLAIASLAAAQAQPAGSSGTQTKPAAQAHPPAPAPLKGVKPPPQAKTPEEYAAFNTAFGSAQGPDLAAGEAAAREFQAKYPQSELASQLYTVVFFNSIQANNADKAIDMGREALKLEPTNPVASVYTATVLAETTRETDIDAAEKFDEAVKDANAGLQNVDTSLTLAANVTQDQVDGIRADLKARAYDALGLIAFKRKDDAGAEKYLRQSLQATGGAGDPMTHLRLAVTLDRQGKYAEALTEANKAAATAPPDQPVAKQAQAEVDRLKKLTGSGGTATPAPQTTPR
ncbi:MAG: tetratricopeptide repeat protein [Acidobacteriia bacterium]|nr:tetratricopeptide repeat protein [Terriglobia bacterium]